MDKNTISIYSLSISLISYLIINILNSPSHALDLTAAAANSTGKQQAAGPIMATPANNNPRSSSIQYQRLASLVHDVSLDAQLGSLQLAGSSRHSTQGSAQLRFSGDTSVVGKRRSNNEQNLKSANEDFAATKSISPLSPSKHADNHNQQRLAPGASPSSSSSGFGGARSRNLLSAPASGPADAAGSIDYLETFPTLSVPPKQRATFECDLEPKMKVSQVVWKRLRRLQGESPEINGNNNELPHQASASQSLRKEADELVLLSHNERMINKDPRFKVVRQSSQRWLFIIDNVSALDDGAYYLCQVSATNNHNSSSDNKQASASSVSFSGGAKLNVLMPPKFIDQDMSPSWVQVSELDELTLRCKVQSEPQSSLVWKREDGQPISDQGQQRFMHRIERKPGDHGRLISHDSAELYFNATSRHEAGAYLCIASNGLSMGGVSQRINVDVINCRLGSDKRQQDCSSDAAAAEAEPTTQMSHHQLPTITTVRPAGGHSTRPNAGHHWKLTQTNSGNISQAAKLDSSGNRLRNGNLNSSRYQTLLQPGADKSSLSSSWRAHNNNNINGKQPSTAHNGQSSKPAASSCDPRRSNESTLILLTLIACLLANALFCSS